MDPHWSFDGVEIMVRRCENFILYVETILIINFHKFLKFFYIVNLAYKRFKKKIKMITPNPTNA